MGMYCGLRTLSADDAARIAIDPSSADSFLDVRGTEGTLSLEKAWHGLHFLLTGSDWGGEPPLDFLRC